MASIKPVGFQWYVDIKKGDLVVESVQVGTAKNRALELKFRQNLDNFSYEVGQSSDSDAYTILGQLPPAHSAVFRRVSTVAGRPIVLPKYWSPVQSYTCQMFPVEKDSEEYATVQTMFADTMGDATIQTVQRIQNLLTLHKYYAENRKIASDCRCGDEQPVQTEHLLFHGTKNLSPTAIISSQEGFDTRLASSQNLWGPATYFAEDAAYADKYAFRTGPTTRQMMVASVAIGSCFDYGTLCNPTLNQPPIDVHNKGRYHSVSGITKDSRVYAIFNSNQCLPQYVITYDIASR